MKEVRKAVLFLAAVMSAAGAAGASMPPVKIVLFPFREAVIASRVDSTIDSYEYRPGQAFPAGAVLVKLDDRRFAIELKRAEEQYNYAEATYNDQKQLHQRNFTSDFELKKREFEFGTAENNLAEARLNMSYCTIEAPFAGRVEEIVTREHETIRAGQPLFRIIDDNQLLAVMNIPVTEMQRYTLGSTVTISIPENRLNATGVVYEVMPRADHRSSTIQIKALIDNANAALTAGMTGILVANPAAGPASGDDDGE